MELYREHLDNSTFNSGGPAVFLGHIYQDALIL